eukprot:12120-Heterococcus_DN1.PRE.4
MLYPTATTPLLNELRGGSFTGLSRAEFKEQYPDIWKQREADKLDFRFPGEGGESYMDVIQRVRPIIVELERQPRSYMLIVLPNDVQDSVHAVNGVECMRQYGCSAACASTVLTVLVPGVECSV